MSETPIWLIWSNEHGMWWRPASCGYTRVIEQAGRYGITEATEICDGANRFLRKGVTHEVRVLSPEGTDTLLNGTIDRIAKGIMKDAMDASKRDNPSDIEPVKQ